MIDAVSLSGLFLQTLSLREIYFQWESAGVFDFFLPALLIFAVIFGALSSTKVLGNHRGINAIIALAIAVLAIRVPTVSEFFSTIFPSFGIGLAIVLVIVIVMGMFVTKGNFPEFANTLMWGGLGVGAIIAVITLNQYDWFGSIWWQDNWVTVLFILILVLLIMPMLQKEKTEAEKAARRKEHFGDDGKGKFMVLRGE